MATKTDKPLRTEIGVEINGEFIPLPKGAGITLSDEDARFIAKLFAPLVLAST